MLVAAYRLCISQAVQENTRWVDQLATAEKCVEDASIQGKQELQRALDKMKASEVAVEELRALLEEKEGVIAQLRDNLDEQRLLADSARLRTHCDDGKGSIFNEIEDFIQAQAQCHLDEPRTNSEDESHTTAFLHHLLPKVTESHRHSIALVRFITFEITIHSRS